MTNSIYSVAQAYLAMLQPEEFLTQDEFDSLTEEDQNEYEELLFELSPSIIKRVIKARQTQRDAVGLKGKEAEYTPSSRNTKRQKLDHKYGLKAWSAGEVRLMSLRRQLKLSLAPRRKPVEDRMAKTSASATSGRLSNDTLRRLDESKQRVEEAARRTDEALKDWRQQVYKEKKYATTKKDK
jgi:hypothetical protein